MESYSNQVTIAVATDQTAQTIMNAALTLVGERGLKGATMAAIAQRAKVNEVTLFRKFGTKMSLVKAALIDLQTTVEEKSVLYSGDIETDLIRLAQSVSDTFKVFGACLRVIIVEAPNIPELAEVVAGSQRMFGTAAEMLNRYQDEGVLLPEPTASLLPAFMGPVVVPHLVGSHGWSPVLDFGPFDAKNHVQRFLLGRQRKGSDNE